MHGRDGEDWKQKRHMWSVPPREATIGNSSPWGGAYFCKDGHKISVGDCALFQAEGSPPLIGIIRCLTSSKEDPPKLGVNWLYRPADVKLGKGILFDPSPNEVFYSLHKDDISVAFLLHPCKVAFLREGVELPPGISSFVCRRLYDTGNKCLWWLTDKDYRNEWQEEVNQLLDKTQLEMYAEGRSPKPVNSTASLQHLKSSSDSALNNTSPFSSQVKGKERERGHQGSQPVKHEHSSKTDDLEHARSENMIRLEVAKIIDKEGGLVNLDGAEKLVQLMQSDRPGRKIDLAGQIMLADVIAATERFDCLAKFVQLRGLPILDDWLQEAHKGKVGDGNGLKEGDKGIQELLLALLCALDKLPVNLHALQSCNIGKSVNHLRTHKNIEIHRKAKSLVDAWKKRVDAEMKSNDIKSGSTPAASWPGKSSFSEVSHVGSKRNGPSDVQNGPVSPPATIKAAFSKTVHTDSGGKLAVLSPGFAKLSLPASTESGTKDSNSKIAAASLTSDLPVPTVKEERSSSSSQSQNNSQSCSSDHTKVAGSSWKEEARSSTAGSITRTSSSSSRHRKSSNGYLGSGASGILKESGAGKLGSASRNMACNKISQPGVTSEINGAFLRDNVNGQKLVVRLPNPSQSPAQSASGCSLEDIAVMGIQASSLGMSNKHDLGERKLKGDVSWGAIAPKINDEPWHGNDMKDVRTGFGQGDGSLIVASNEERNRNCEDVGKYLGSSAGNDKRTIMAEAKYTKSYGASLNPMNALVESCVKYSEIPASLSGDDDLGMNLLASVAAGEISNSELASPSSSPVSSSSQEDLNNEKDVKSRFSRGNLNTQETAQLGDPGHDHPEKKGEDVASLKDREGLEFRHNVSQCALDGKSGSDQIETHQPEKLSANSEVKPSESNGVSSIEIPLAKATELPRTEKNKRAPGRIIASENEKDMDDFMDVEMKPKCPQTVEKVNAGPVHEKVAGNSMTMPGTQHLPLCDGSKIVHGALNHVIKDTKEDPLSSPAGETDGSSKRPLEVEGSVGEVSSEEKQRASAASSVTNEIRSADTGSLCGATISACPDDLEKLKSETAEALEGKSVKELNDSENMNQASNQVDAIDEKTDARVGKSAVIDQDERVVDNQQLGASASGDKSPLAPPLESEEVPVKSVGGECVRSASEVAPSGEENTGAADTASKLDFDLNEGFPTDEGHQDAPVFVIPISSNVVNQPSPLPFSVSTISNGIAASITVASPAKRAFIPPENMLSSKGDTRWKGSAARSAFRRAEPWRVQEALVSMSEVSTSDSSLGKQGRALLDIDLNVADERVPEDGISQCSASQQAGHESDVKPLASAIIGSTSTCSAGKLDLDLNRAEEGPETMGISSWRLDIPLLSARPSSSTGGLSNGGNAPRDFDLNNGPGLDEVGMDPTPCYAHAKSCGSYVPSVANIRMSTDLGSTSSWFPAGGSYPQVALHPFVSDRGEQPYPTVATSGSIQKILGSTSGGLAAYSADIYRTPVLSSSPAISFPSTNAFPYANFPFGGGFLLAATSFTAGSTYTESSSGVGPCFPAVQSQLVGPVAAVSSPYVRPYLINHPDGITVKDNWTWPRQGLDLNTGPGNIDVDARDDRFAAVRQLSSANPRILTEEQMKIYQAAGALKRKEPDGGWDAERFVYKQPSWQ